MLRHKGKNYFILTLGIGNLQYNQNFYYLHTHVTTYSLLHFYYSPDYFSNFYYSPFYYNFYLSHHSTTIVFAITFSVLLVCYSFILKC